eukprot:scaffold228_cov312-Pinguiococcus_pyrenoidosus.AAC.35
MRMSLAAGGDLVHALLDEPVLEQLLGGRPLVRVLRQAGVHEVVELGRPVGRLGEPGRRVGRDGEDGPHRIQSEVGRLSLRKLDGRDAHGPDVRLAVVALLLDDLWRHPERRPDDRAALGERAGDVGAHAEVGDLGLSVRREQDVSRLDVTMDVPLVV